MLRGSGAVTGSSLPGGCPVSTWRRRQWENPPFLCDVPSPTSTLLLGNCLPSAPCVGLTPQKSPECHNQPPLSVLCQTLRSQSLPERCFSRPSIILMTISATTLLLNGLKPRALSKPNERCSLSKAERLWQEGQSAVLLPKEIQTVRRTRNQPESKRDPSPSPKHLLPSLQGLQTLSRAPVVGPAPNSNPSTLKTSQTGPCSPYFAYF